MRRIVRAIGIRRKSDKPCGAFVNASDPNGVCETCGWYRSSHYWG